MSSPLDFSTVDPTRMVPGRVYHTGALRDSNADKPRPDLISPFMLMRLGKWLAKGASKYGARNWEKGIPNSVCWESLMRHVVKCGMGMTDEDHLSAIIFNAMAIVHNQETNRTDLDDMPTYTSFTQLTLPLEGGGGNA